MSTLICNRCSTPCCADYVPATRDDGAVNGPYWRGRDCLHGQSMCACGGFLSVRTAAGKLYEYKEGI